MGGSCTYEFNINDYPSPFAENFKLLSPGEIADDDVEEGEDLPDDLYVEESNDHESVNNRINQPSMSIYYMNSLIQEDNAHNDKVTTLPVSDEIPSSSIIALASKGMG